MVVAGAVADLNAALLTLLGVTGHGLMRLVSSRKTH
jgi:hypothetical protein